MAGNNEYILPIGIDAGGLVTGISKGKQSIVDLKNTALEGCIFNKSW